MEDQEDNEKPRKPTTHDERGAADLERVTDYVEEKELSVGLDACQELEVSKLTAERHLKEHQGNVFETLVALCK
ncbi:Huntingtin-interacting protein HYPK [Schistosoma japonicum]|nr:Huntingtin-interacting protein HYPK [Schistosoma japonicum]